VADPRDRPAWGQLLSRGAAWPFALFEEYAEMCAKILVADDSSTMRKIIIRSLNAVGRTDVVEAADGNEAVARFEAETVELVLTDWNMPGKNGLEVIRHIRERNASVPIIMVTTEAEKQRVLEAIQAGVTDYLVKPFTSEALREKLDKHTLQLA
jgi:two-component system chemotaxis response regulator CheY